MLRMTIKMPRMTITIARITIVVVYYVWVLAWHHQGAVFAWKFFNVWFKRFDRGPVDPRCLESIEKRLAELEEWNDRRLEDDDHRIAEVEERMDFVERVMGQQRERKELPQSEQG